MRYDKAATLGAGTIRGVTVVAFSPDGLYVAAAGRDSVLRIWRISDSRMLHTFITASPIFSLLWLSDAENSIVCGMEDGALSTVQVGKSKIKGQNFPRYHNFVVERLASYGSSLASGALEELAIWKRQRNGQYEHQVDLGLPPRNSINKGEEVIVTSIHWIHSRTLLVTYMYHGYLLYNTSNWQLMHHSLLNGRIGDASMTPDGTRLVVSNMCSGFDIYDAETGLSLASLTHPVNQVRAVPVRFIHGGNAVLGGSTVGEAHVWDVTGIRMHPPLVVGEDSEVLAIAAHYDRSRDRFLIATGVTNPPEDSAVTLWVAAEGPRVAWWSFRWLPGREFCLSIWYLMYGLLLGTLVMLIVAIAADYKRL